MWRDATAHRTVALLGSESQSASLHNRSSGKLVYGLYTTSRACAVVTEHTAAQSLSVLCSRG